MENKMNPDLLEKLKYPIGRFEHIEKLDKETLDTYTRNCAIFLKSWEKQFKTFQKTILSALTALDAETLLN